MRITISAVVIIVLDTQGMAKTAQAVLDKVRFHLPRKPYRAELSGSQIKAAGFQVMLDKRIVEVDIVRHEYLILQQRVDVFCYFRERRSASYQVRRYAR
jgi:hypothetical protein